MDRLLEILKKSAAWIVLLGAAYLGEKGQDGGLIKDVWGAAKTASPFAAMFAVLAWLDERRERREAQRQCNERTIDFVKSTNGAVAAFDRALAKIQATLTRKQRR